MGAGAEKGGSLSGSVSADVIDSVSESITWTWVVVGSTANELAVLGEGRGVMVSLLSPAGFFEAVGRSQVSLKG